LQIADCKLRIASSRLRRGIVRFAILNLHFAIGFCAYAQGNSSLSEFKTEIASEGASAKELLKQNEQLQKQLSTAQESVKALTSSLAESNAQAEELRRKYSDLELRMEALGLASASKDRAKLEQRLLSAVSDLQLAQKERDGYRDQMLRLNEAIVLYLQTSQGGDAKARMDMEAQLRSTNMLISKSEAGQVEAEPSLMDGSVISVKDEWSFVVGNLGEKAGVKIGMPMRVMRNDRRIATVRVVDVRQKICGAVIQELDSNKEKIRVGDRLQVDAQSNVSLK
jgi:predicted RNase H-like nuclease (RuvC/YqgF family)